MHGPPRAVFLGHGRTKQGHDAIAGVLVDGALEAVHLGGEQSKAVVHDLVHHFRVKVPGQGHEAGRLGEQHRDLLAFPFQRAARGENLLRQVCGRVRARHACLTVRRHGCRLWGRAGTPCPDQDAPRFIDGQALALDELLREDRQACRIQLQLELQRPIGHPAPLA